MIDACSSHGVKLMIAYRLHFEEANLGGIDLVRRGHIGEPQIFTSSFALTVRRATSARSGRPAVARSTTSASTASTRRATCSDREPVEVMALSVHGGGARLSEIDEATGAVLRFEGERVATFVTSFNANDAAWYQHHRHQGAGARRPGVRICRRPGIHPDHERRPDQTQARWASATSSPPSCCTSPTASCTTERPSPPGARDCRTSASSRPFTSRRALAGPSACSPIMRPGGQRAGSASSSPASRGRAWSRCKVPSAD